ncbi:MAG: EscU/YscU/HrcU family type III secretion system export apparatus switch protein [Campylobacterota bacterium]|nr:EscU/YscU/HrcU family type III secretion system export apparatus switch protein [Campylobacterota bacterium]
MENKNFVQKATALKYNIKKDNAPKVMAQGKRETAKSIIKIANENGIPIKKDEDLVNILSQLELNQEIPEELYKSVSEVFKFIYDISNEQKGDKKDEKKD